MIAVLLRFVYLAFDSAFAASDWSFFVTNSLPESYWRSRRRLMSFRAAVRLFFCLFFFVFVFLLGRTGCSWGGGGGGSVLETGLVGIKYPKQLL